MEEYESPSPNFPGKFEESEFPTLHLDEGFYPKAFRHEEEGLARPVPTMKSRMAKIGGDLPGLDFKQAPGPLEEQKGEILLTWEDIEPTLSFRAPEEREQSSKIAASFESDTPNQLTVARKTSASDPRRHIRRRKSLKVSAEKLRRIWKGKSRNRQNIFKKAFSSPTIDLALGRRRSDFFLQKDLSEKQI